MISLSNQHIYYILLLYPNVQMHKCTFTVVQKLLTFSQLLPINLPPPGRVCAKKNQIPKRRATRMISVFQKCIDSFQIASCAASFSLICSYCFDLLICFGFVGLLRPITALHWLISIPILTYQ